MEARDPNETLRESAERLLRRTPGDFAEIGPDDLVRTVHELRVHEMELVLQNEELQRSQTELSESRDRYCELYERAPMGLITLDRNGAIVEANLTFADLMDLDRCSLIDQPLARYVAPYSQDTLHLHLHALFEERAGGRDRFGVGAPNELSRSSRGGSLMCDLVLAAAEEGVRIIRLESLVDPSDSGERVVRRSTVLDVTESVQLRRLIDSTTTAEQHRIGRELHDGIGQEITALSMLAESLVDRLAEEARPELKEAQRISVALRRAGSLARSLAHGLIGVEERPTGLMRALRGLASQFDQPPDLACTFECPSPILVEDPSVANHLYRIAQEACSNATRHSGATSIRIEWAREGNRSVLRVTDDGRWSEPDPRDLDGVGRGLQIMQDRARTIGAHLWIESGGSAEGTRVQCLVPARC